VQDVTQIFVIEKTSSLYVILKHVMANVL